jgi:hypothetical protein
MPNKFQRCLTFIFCCGRRGRRRFDELDGDGSRETSEAVPAYNTAQGERDARTLTHARIVAGNGVAVNYAIDRQALFTTLNRNGIDPPIHGWKIHVSIDNNDIAAAWNIIMPHLVRAGVCTCKVIHDATRDRQRGKEIVIYRSDIPAQDNNVDWQQLLTDIERDLRAANIQPGPVPQFRFDQELSDLVEPRINGSQYFYVANDARPTGEVRRLHADRNEDALRGREFAFDVTPPARHAGPAMT